MKAQATVFKKIDKYVIKVHLSLYMRGKHICIYIEKKIFKQKKNMEPAQNCHRESY